MEKMIEARPEGWPIPRLVPEPLPIWERAGVAAAVLRLDRMDPDWGGNKWFKLRWHLAAAQQKKAHTLVSFGGWYSNHLWALAAVGQQWGFKTKAFVTGHHPGPNALEKKGMTCIAVDRTSFADPQKIQANWEQEGEHWIPMGGADAAGILGASSILEGLDLQPYDHLVCAVGTGTTAIGLAQSSWAQHSIWGIAAGKDLSLAETQKATALTPAQQARLSWKTGFEAGGYGRAKKDLLAFMNQWYTQTGIPTDRVYTGKMFWALDQMVQSQALPPGSSLLVVHSGGMAGNRSLAPGTLLF